MKSKRELLRERRERNKWKLERLSLADMTVLPRGFLCVWVRKNGGKTPDGSEVGMHRAMVTANAHSENDFQYVMHEFDDWLLRRMR